MPKDNTKRHVKVETELRRTSGTETAHERMKAEPETEDLREPEEVWKDSEKTPTGETGERSGYRGRVADAGDVGGGQASPYGTPAQADALARQTERTGEPRGVEKPKRG